MSKIEATTTNSLELPEYWQFSDLYKTNLSHELGFSRTVKSAVFV